MKTMILKIAALTAVIMTASLASFGQTYVQQLGYDAPDGDRITGFIYQSVETKKDAPLAVLMHGMTGSSLYWLAAENVMHGDDITAKLVERGYRVLALDARVHGARSKEQKPMELVKAARGGDSAAYQAMIIQTVGDYRYILDKLLERFKSEQVLVVGYSMGAQMGTLLAATDNRVTHLVTMVPPAIRNVPEVSPIHFAADVKVPWLLITAENDQFSSTQQNVELIEKAGPLMRNVSFDSKHMLPGAYVLSVENWLNTQ